MRSFRNGVVTQSNALTSSHYAMSLNEKRLLVAAISQLNPRSKAWLDGKASVSITAHQWAESFGTKKAAAYSELRKASAMLYSRSVRIKGDHVNGKNIRWISAEEYSRDEGCVTLTFSGDILFHLSGMLDEFTSYDLLGVSGLKSTYSIRLYELASQFKKTGWRYCELEDLRSSLGTGDAYPKFADFRKRVLDHACKEVSRKADIEVSWTPVKKGRRIIAVDLRIVQKTQLDMF